MLSRNARDNCAAQDKTQEQIGSVASLGRTSQVVVPLDDIVAPLKDAVGVKQAAQCGQKPPERTTESKTFNRIWTNPEGSDDELR